MLIQLWAPLVHAHTANGEAGGQLHLPGLEFLERLPGEGWHAPASESSVVIAVQNGILEPSRALWPCQADKPAPDDVPCRIEAEAQPLARAKAFPPHPVTLPVPGSPSSQAPPARGPPR
ncbi:hypothetical protein GNH96_14170 [Methylococcus geothermalis]|uniref:Uncharacterized protein n=1 Tax=Methylococcus geothermalis TaxID=2681310 RepID=A0A858QBA7_9GAMM|nr:hypothetical protein GNH96_14170 [Methylococcus geothermalis]